MLIFQWFPVEQAVDQRLQEVLAHRSTGFFQYALLDEELDDMNEHEACEGVARYVGDSVAAKEHAHQEKEPHYKNALLHAEIHARRPEIVKVPAQQSWTRGWESAHRCGRVRGMWNLEFRAPGRELSVAELVARAWPQATPRQRDAAFAAGEVRLGNDIVRDSKTRVPPGTLCRVVAREGQQALAADKIAILQRGEDFCVVDKPRGWPSHEATPGGPDARTLVAAALACAVDEIWPVHRLDADVGGAWLIALSKAAAARLSESFASTDVQKEYRAVTPSLPWREGRFRAGIDGKPAETIFRVLSDDAADSEDERNDKNETCAVSLTLITGRTHQLRRHLCGARCSILGDSLYGGVMVAGGLRLYSRSISIEREGIHAIAPEPPGFRVTEPVYSVSSQPIEITVSHATAVALERGHPWILTDTETSDVGGLRPGSLVRARSVRGKDIGECRIEGPGRIAARVWSRVGKSRPNTAAASSITSRIKLALERRSKLIQGISSEQATTVFRLVHGEADGLPGLMIDRVGGDLRVLSMWRGTEAFEREAIDAVIETLGGDPPVVMVRHFADRPKGQFLSVEAYRGEPCPRPFSVEERGLLFEVDTGLADPFRSRPGFGLYIDQRANRDRITKRIRTATGGRWLNLFCHTGAFSIAALAAGADEVTSVDLSRPYLNTLERNLELNNIDSSRHQSIKLDVQRFVEKWSSRDRYDGIILDPPTAAAAGKQFWSVRKGQAQLVEQCLSHLTPKGTLLVCRNDHGAREDLRGLVNRAAAKAGVRLKRINEAGPGSDFPEVEGFREGNAFDGVIATRG